MPTDQNSIAGLLQRHKRLLADRSNWESHWQDVLDYCVPRKATVITQGTPGEKRMTNVYDSTPIRACEILAAGMNNALTSSVNKWFALKIQDENFMNEEAVTTWLQDTEMRIYNALNNSNFSTEIHDSYLDDGTIGTSILYAEEDAKDILRFATIHISEVVVCENSKGRIDTVFRKFQFTARQADQTWGPLAGEKVRKALEKEPDKKIDFLHVVMPRTERDASKFDRLNIPWASLWIQPEDKHLIEEGGYYEFPYMVSRWLKGTRETYGRSPAMTALPDIKMLNEIRKTNLKAGQVAVDPPLLAPDDGVVGSIRLTPSGITYLRASAWDKGRKPEPLNLGKNVLLGAEMEQETRTRINEAFFVDLFLLLVDKPEMTATEVLERVEEKMSVLGPVIGRLMVEKLDPVIDRVFGIMFRAGQFLPPPPVLRGQRIAVDYISPLARAQKMYEAKAVRRTLQDITPYIEISPEIVDNIDPDQLFDVIADVHGFPQRVRRPQELVKAIRQARNEATDEEGDKQDIQSLANTMAVLKKAGVNVATPET